MRDASPDLIAYLNTTNSFIMADLYSMLLIGGTYHYYTNADYPITYEGNTHLSDNILITRTGTRLTIGTEVDTMTLTVTAKPEDLLLGSSWLSAVKMGALDGASIVVTRLFMPTFGDTSLGGILLFSGSVASAQSGRSTAVLTLNSDLQFLNTMMPRNLYQPGCRNVLFDIACTLQKDSWAVPGIVTSSTNTVIQSNLIATASGYFDIGTISFTSGLSNGVTRSVKKFESGVISLAFPLISAPVPGDTFTIYPGCRKTLSDCETRFNNKVNFRGEPFIPLPEAIT